MHRNACVHTHKKSIRADNAVLAPQLLVQAETHDQETWVGAPPVFQLGELVDGTLPTRFWSLVIPLILSRNLRHPLSWLRGLDCRSLSHGETSRSEIATRRSLPAAFLELPKTSNLPMNFAALR